MFGSSLWQLIATYLSWPVSGTHSIVSGLLGFSLVAHGPEGVNWSEMITIVIGWIASPIVSAILTTIVYLPLNRFVLSDRKFVFSTKNKIVYSLLWGLTIGFDVGSILTISDVFLDLSGLGEGTFWGMAAGAALVSGIIAFFFVMPFLEKKSLEIRVEDNYKQSDGSNTNKAFSNEATDEQTETEGIEIEEQPITCCNVTFQTKSDAIDDTPEQQLIFKPLHSGLDRVNNNHNS